MVPDTTTHAARPGAGFFPNTYRANVERVSEDAAVNTRISNTVIRQLGSTLLVLAMLSLASPCRGVGFLRPCSSLRPLRDFDSTLMVHECDVPKPGYLAGDPGRSPDHRACRLKIPNVTDRLVNTIAKRWMTVSNRRFPLRTGILPWGQRNFLICSRLKRTTRMRRPAPKSRVSYPLSRSKRELVHAVAHTLSFLKNICVNWQDAGPWLFAGLVLGGLLKVVVRPRLFRKWLEVFGIMPIFTAIPAGTLLLLCSWRGLISAMLLHRSEALQGPMPYSWLPTRRMSSTRLRSPRLVWGPS